MDEELQRLLQEKIKQINRYLIRLGADRNDAEDIVQDAVYKGLLYIDSIDPEKFFGWLYKVALNGYYDLCRKRKRIHIPIDSVSLEDGEAIEDLIFRKEQREEIESVLEELPPLYKQLLIMKYELDLTYQEISKLLDLKIELVKTYLYRARKQFQKIYGRDES